MRKTLIIGYGNRLRSDDGVGHAVAVALIREPALPATEIIGCHQLTPELAEDLAAVERAVFVDAEAGPAAGSVRVTRLEAVPLPSSGLAHHVDPRALLCLARRLYGRAPEAWLVTVACGSLELGQELSAPVATALPNVMNVVRRLVLDTPEH